MFFYVIISSFIIAIAAASCVPNPCHHGGTCSGQVDPKKVRCTCTSGWEGRFCTIPFRYIGCYEDNADRIMPVFLPYSVSNSPLECAARCHAYPYSGTQVGYTCFCGDSLNAVKKPDSECDQACAGDKSKKCGGEWRMSVYSNRALEQRALGKRKSSFRINAE